MAPPDRSPGMPDAYDRLLGALHGLPDVIASRPSTLRTVEPLVGNTETFIVQTYRQRERGDTVFLEMVGGNGSFRLAIPPSVADAIARQRESLNTKSRSKAAKAAAQERQERKDRGESPALNRRETTTRPEEDAAR